MRAALPLVLLLLRSGGPGARRFTENLQCLDINTASQRELQKVKGIGKEFALRLIMGRTCFFSSEADFETRFRALSANEVDDQNAWGKVGLLLEQGKLCVGCTDDKAQQTAVDVNVATINELRRVRSVSAAGQNFGISKGVAERILRGRTCPYKSMVNLRTRLAQQKEGSTVDESNLRMYYLENVKKAINEGLLCQLGGQMVRQAPVLKEEPAIGEGDEDFDELSMTEGSEIYSSRLEEGEDEDGTPSREELQAIMKRAQAISRDSVLDETPKEEDGAPVGSCRLEEAEAANMWMVPSMILHGKGGLVVCREGRALSEDPEDVRTAVTCDRGEVAGLGGKACAPVDCGDPTEAFGGEGVQSFEGSTRFGGNTSLTCKEGWASRGRRTFPVKCLSTGGWDAVGVKCMLVQCEAPKKEVETCPAGTSLDGRPCGKGQGCSVEVQCGTRPPEVQCQAVQCDLPALDPKSSLVTELDGQEHHGAFQRVAGLLKLAAGRPVSYTCIKGFMMTHYAVPSLTLTCGADGRLQRRGRWDAGAGLSAAPACVPLNCGPLKQSKWWVEHKDFYEALFDVNEYSQIFGEAGADLFCKFRHVQSNCLRKYTVSTTFAIQHMILKNSEVHVTCGEDGHWEEPPDFHTQTCAYPLGSKDLGERHDLASLIFVREDDRVLTVVPPGDEARVEVRGYERYNLAQRWSLDPTGLIYSAAQAPDPEQQSSCRCLTAIDPSTYVIPSTGWFESYLYTTDCSCAYGDVEAANKQDAQHVWHLGPELEQGLAKFTPYCKQHENCCSLSFSYWRSQFSDSHNYFLTFPLAEGIRNDWRRGVYFWSKDGTIEEEHEGQYRPIGWRVDDNGAVMKCTEDRKVITEMFIFKSEPYPKLLKTWKMSSSDMRLAVLDAWVV